MKTAPDIFMKAIYSQSNLEEKSLSFRYTVELWSIV